MLKCIEDFHRTQIFETPVDEEKKLSMLLYALAQFGKFLTVKHRLHKGDK